MHDIDLWIWPLIGLTFMVLLRYFVFQFPAGPPDSPEENTQAFLLMMLVVTFPFILLLWDQRVDVPDFFDFLGDSIVPFILYMVGVAVAVEAVNCGLCD